MAIEIKSLHQRFGGWSKCQTCNEKQRSAGVTPLPPSVLAASSSTKLRRPLKETSIPFTTYGRSTNVSPFFASCKNQTHLSVRPLQAYSCTLNRQQRCKLLLLTCSILYPGLGSFDIFKTRANRSRQFPTAMSTVSPKIRYLPSL